VEKLDVGMEMLKRLFFITLLVFFVGCHSNRGQVYDGYVEGRFTYVSSQTNGVLQQLLVVKGEQVKQNKILFQLETTPNQADYGQAQSKLEQAKAELVNLSRSKRPSEIAAIKAQGKQTEAQLDFALRTMSRLSALNKKGYANQQDLDQAVSGANDLKAKLLEISKNLKTAESSFGREGEVAAAEANVKAAEAALDKALWTLSQTKINAPIDGVVFDTFYREGEVVPAQHPILALLSPKNIYAVFYVPERQLSTIKLGQSISLTCDSCQTEIKANISYISPEAEYTPQVFYTENSRSKFVFRIEATFSENDAIKLHPGQPVSIII
jgi:HlyD family secretion protein